MDGEKGGFAKVQFKLGKSGDVPGERKDSVEQSRTGQNQPKRPITGLLWASLFVCLVELFFFSAYSLRGTAYAGNCGERRMKKRAAEFWLVVRLGEGAVSSL